MKAFLILAFLFCNVGIGSAQRVQSDCSGQDSIMKLYKEDAAWVVYSE